MSVAMILPLIMAAAEPAASASTPIDWSAVFAVIRNILTVISLGAGLFFILAGTVGVLRLPDIYTRLHAAGMTDTLGAELILLGLILQADGWQMVAKLLLVAFFLFVTSPTATHAVAHAAWRAGEKPRLGPYKAAPLEDET